MRLTWKGKHEGIFELSELAADRIKAPPPLFSGLILDNSITMVTAPPFVGKSLLLASMAVSLDTGLPLFGKYPPTGPRKVVMVAQDAPTWDYAQQFAKTVRGYGLTPEQAELLEAKIIVNRGIQVVDTAFEVYFEDLHKQFPFEVLILDAFWTLHNLNENDNGQMALVMERLKALREQYNISIIFSHHSKKPTEGSGAWNANHTHRGASVISAAVDFNLLLKRSKQRVTLEIGKGRGGDEGTIPYDIVEVDHEGGPAIKLEAAAMDTVRHNRLWSALKERQNRKTLVHLYREWYPDMTFDKCKRAVDNDLQLLQSQRKAERVGHGWWLARE